MLKYIKIIILCEGAKVRKYFIPAEGNFYKANLHTHTTVSDGKLTPEEAKERFKSLGYSVVAYTDHELMVPHPELCDSEFLALTGYELSINEAVKPPFTRTYHLNYYSPDIDRSASRTMAVSSVWNKEHMQCRITDEMRALSTERRVYSKEFVQRIVDLGNAEGALISYNHPVWSLQSRQDYEGLHGFFGIEWANTGCIFEDYPDTTEPIEYMLNNGVECYPLATDDCHKANEYGHSWVVIRAKELEYSTVFEALRRGDFYSSTGPEIFEAYAEDGKVYVKTSPARSIHIVAGHRQRITKRSDDGTLCEAVFDLAPIFERSEAAPEGAHPWIRIDVFDKLGKIARTKAIFLCDLPRAVANND